MLVSAVQAISRGTTKVDHLPVFFEGTVIKGFGRGSKELGCPTANIPIDPYKEILEKIPVGVYYGYAQVNDGPVHKVAMSIGWNPYYKNTTKTIEIHIIHKFESDFYGEHLRVAALGYIRPEYDFKSLDDLIQAIKDDIHYAVTSLDATPHTTQITQFFKPAKGKHSL